MKSKNNKLILFNLLFIPILYIKMFSTFDWKTFIWGSPDSLLVLYFLEQVSNNILNFNPLFQGSIFYPEENTLAFSHLLFTLQIVYLPLRLLIKNSNICYNLSFLFILLFLGNTLFLTIHSIYKSFYTSLLFCILFYFNIYVSSILSMHPQMVLGLLSFPMIIYLQKYLKQPSLIYLGILYFILFILFSGDPSTGVMVLIPVLLLLLLNPIKIYNLIIKNKVINIYFISLTFGFLISISYFLIVYFQVSRLPEAKRSIEEISLYSTRLNSMFLFPYNSLLYNPSKLSWGEHEAMHFMSFSFGVFLIYNIKLKIFRNHEYRVLLIIFILSYLISFGPIVQYKDLIRFPNIIYNIFLYLIPGLSSTRSIGREFLIILPIVLYFAIGNIKNVKSRFVHIIFIIIFFLENHVTQDFTKVVIWPENHIQELSQLISEPKITSLKIPFERWPSNQSEIMTWMFVSSKLNLRTIEGYSGISPKIRDSYESKFGNLHNLIDSKYEWKELIFLLEKDKVDILIIEKNKLAQPIDNQIYSSFKFKESKNYLVIYLNF